MSRFWKSVHRSIQREWRFQVRGDIPRYCCASVHERWTECPGSCITILHTCNSVQGLTQVTRRAWACYAHGNRIQVINGNVCGEGRPTDWQGDWPLRGRNPLPTVSPLLVATSGLIAITPPIHTIAHYCFDRENPRSPSFDLNQQLSRACILMSQYTYNNYLIISSPREIAFSVFSTLTVITHGLFFLLQHKNE